MSFPIEMIDAEPPQERPTHGEILCAVCDAFEASPEEVLTWLVEFDRRAAYAEYLASLGTLKGQCENK